jgi:hypothetical protein
LSKSPFLVSVLFDVQASFLAALLRGHRRSDGLVFFRGPSANLNHAGLQPLRQLAIELDKQQPVLYVSATHFDMIGEPKSDARRRRMRCRNVRSASAAFFSPRIESVFLIYLDFGVFLAEPGERHSNPVLILGETLDVVGADMCSA